MSKSKVKVHIVNPIRGEHHTVEAGNAAGARSIVERMAKRNASWSRTRRIQNGRESLIVTDTKYADAKGGYCYASFWEAIGV